MEANDDKLDKMIKKLNEDSKEKFLILESRYKRKMKQKSKHKPNERR